MLGLGWQEMLAVAAIAVVIIGPKHLPEVARTLGKAMAYMRRASNDLRDAINNEVNQYEEMRDLKDMSNSINSEMFSIERQARNYVEREAEKIETGFADEKATEGQAAASGTEAATEGQAAPSGTEAATEAEAGEDTPSEVTTTKPQAPLTAEAEVEAGMIRDPVTNQMVYPSELPEWSREDAKASHERRVAAEQAEQTPDATPADDATGTEDDSTAAHDEAPAKKASAS